MNHLFREMPIILEENGGTEDMLYQKKKVAFKVPQWTDFYDSMTYHNVLQHTISRELQST